MASRHPPAPGHITGPHRAAHRSQEPGGPVVLTDTGAIYFAAGVDLERDVVVPMGDPTGRAVLPIARWDRETGAGWSTVPGLAPADPEAYAKAYPAAPVLDYRTPLLALPEHADDIERGLAYANALALEHIPRAQAIADATGRQPDVRVQLAPAVYDLIAMAYTRKGATPPTEIAWPYGVRLVRQSPP